MDNKGISYELVDVSQDQAALDMITKLGYKQVPVVIANNDHWSGFRPDKINSIK
jgi:glutaredoxin-like protein NrdH